MTRRRRRAVPILLRPITLAATVVVTGVAGGPAGAGTPTRTGMSSALGTTLATPVARIVTWANTSGYSPGSLGLAWSGPVLQRCNSSSADLSIKNRTNRMKSVTLDGAPFVSVAPDSSQMMCFWGSGTRTIVLGIAGFASTLTLRLA
jgi:hypothetical protein